MPTNVVFQQTTAHLLDSVCVSADRQGTEAGAMTLGGYDERLHDSPMVFTVDTVGNKVQTGFFGSVPNENFHVHIRAIHLRHGDGGGSAAAAVNTNPQIITLNVTEQSMNSPRMIVASGTTDTYLPGHVEALFKSAYYRIAGTHYSHSSVMLTRSELEALPTILLQLAGDETRNSDLFGNTAPIDPVHPLDVILAIPPTHYMEYIPGSRVYTPRIYFDGQNPCLGANAMMGHDIFFDVDENIIGWAESNCDYHALLEENGFQDTTGKQEDDKDTVDEFMPLVDDFFVQPTSPPTSGSSTSVSKEEPLMNEQHQICSSWFNCNHTAAGALLGSCLTLVLGFVALTALRNRSGRYSSVLGQEELEMNDLSDDFPSHRHYEIAPGGIENPEVTLPSVT